MIWDQKLMLKFTRSNACCELFTFPEQASAGRVTSEISIFGAGGKQNKLDPFSRVNSSIPLEFAS